MTQVHDPLYDEVLCAFVKHGKVASATGHVVTAGRMAVDAWQTRVALRKCLEVIVAFCRQNLHAPRDFTDARDAAMEVLPEYNRFFPVRPGWDEAGGVPGMPHL